MQTETSASYRILSLAGSRIIFLLLLVFTLPGHAQISSSPELIAEPNTLVTLRDNITVSVDIYRPSTSGSFPTLYAAGPFPHASDNSPPSGPLTGPVAWYVEQGFAVVIASSRGTGGSSGNYQFLSRDEQQDHYELIEWIAEQSWSDQRVAGYGAGYYATSQWMMAIQSPPHLECIAPYNGVLDPYRDWAYPGGLANTGFSLDWYDREIRQANAYPPSGPGQIIDFDMRLQQLQHPLYDNFWQLRSARENLNQIRVPVFAMRSLSPGQAGAATTLRALSMLNSPNKVLVTDDTVPQNRFESIEFHAGELLPYYQWCLRDSGREYIERPRVRFQVRGQETLKRDSSWPPGNVSPAALFLSPGNESTGMLGFSQAASGTRSSSLGSSGETDSLVFVSDALANDIEVTGALMLELYVSTTASDTAFIATLSETGQTQRIMAAPTGMPSFLQPDRVPELNPVAVDTELEVSQGILKASMRATDPELSLDSQPFYSFSGGEALLAGRVYRLDLAMQPVAYRFRRGNRIKLTLRKVSDATLRGRNGRDTLYHSSQYPSKLWLPMGQATTGQ